MDNILVLAVVGLVVGGAVGYIWKTKKKGVKCIGCPEGANCSGSCGSCNCACGNMEKEES